MDRAPSSTGECLSQQVEDLTQVIYSERVISTDLRMEFSELQNKSTPLPLPLQPLLCILIVRIQNPTLWMTGVQNLRRSWERLKQESMRL